MLKKMIELYVESLDMDEVTDELFNDEGVQEERAKTEALLQEKGITGRELIDSMELIDSTTFVALDKAYLEGIRAGIRLVSDINRGNI